MPTLTLALTSAEAVVANYQALVADDLSGRGQRGEQQQPGEAGDQ